ncbi:aspartyl protease family protein [Tamlana sp. 2201CG12-4]|uniref:aspartyl protease family protein n=1 Tax=Tamlana sp. 2201CG12-4 TaxID=3112582 RepID=UPI002DB73438|nr:aspartyl protease family protein [Tamlana sp. 2201CG12-4]MEC3905456.1 aspartyl protease family protein [Tamlana sp. 2201CG12-4]
MKKCLTLLFLFVFLSPFASAQDEFVIQNKRKSDKIKFKLINNLVIIPVEVNGVTLSFLLDTGVSKPIIFNFLNVSDTLQIKDTETIYLRGLGEGESVEALKSKNNTFKIGDAIKLNQDLYAVFNTNLNLAPRLGIPVHGIIGFDLFKDLIVEINYSTKTIKLTEPEVFSYKPCKSCERFSLEFHKKKPYVYALVGVNEKDVPVKLLIDSGGSDAIWLFENEDKGLKPSDKFFYDFLGHGLNGSVYGKRSRVETFSLKSFVLKNANVSYPDTKSVFFAKIIKDRNGSLAGNILKRFDVIFDYQRKLLTLKKNKYFREAFSYNRSGIELAHQGTRVVREVDKSAVGKNGLMNRNETQNNFRIDRTIKYKLVLKPAYVIVELREGSPAEKAGLLKGDIILSINGLGTHQYSLQQVIHKFYDDVNKRIKLKVERDGKILTFSFNLERLL